MPYDNGGVLHLPQHRITGGKIVCHRHGACRVDAPRRCAGAVGGEVRVTSSAAAHKLARDVASGGAPCMTSYRQPWQAQPPVTGGVRHVVGCVIMGLGEGEIAPHHLHRGVPQHIFERKRVAAVSEVRDREGVTRAVHLAGAHARGSPISALASARTLTPF